MRMINIREKDVENYFNRRVKKFGGLSRKWSSPSFRGVPDRITLWPNSVIHIAELKAPNKKPTPLQTREIKKIRSMGVEVSVLDSYEAVDQWLREVVGIKDA